VFNPMPSALSSSSAYFDLLQGALDVGHRREGEQAEAAGVVLHGLDHVFVDQARQTA